MPTRGRLPTVPRRGWFGPFGGQYVPETLMGALEELERVFHASMRDARFRATLRRYLTTYAGRPTPL